VILDAASVATAFASCFGGHLHLNVHLARPTLRRIIGSAAVAADDCRCHKNGPGRPGSARQREECPAFTEVRQRYLQRKKAVGDPGQLLYRIIDALVDTFFPMLAGLQRSQRRSHSAVFDNPKKPQFVIDQKHVTRAAP